MFWIAVFLGMLFLTPIGWIGMMCLGGVIAMILDANKDPYDKAREDVIGALKHRMSVYGGSVEELKEYVDGL